MRILLLAFVLLASCEGVPVTISVGYDKISASASIYRPQGKQPVLVNPQK